VKQTWTGFIAIAFAVAAWQVPMAAQDQGQGRGGRAGGAPAEENFPTAEEFAGSKAAQAHVAAAMKIGGSDMADTAKWFCTATGPQRVALARQAQGLPRLPTVQEGPIKLFDNLTYIGFNDVGAWVVPTSAGLILFDTLNTTDDAMKVIEPEMMKAGFDPAQIKYILVGHGHADHFGGASYLQMKYHAKVLAAMPDWAAIQRGGRGGAAPGLTPDMDVTDGQKLTLGDTTLTLYNTPGHTMGTLSTLIPVTDHGTRHVAASWGGTAFNWVANRTAYITPDRPDRFWFQTYSDSARRFKEIAAKAGADVLISNHTIFDGSKTKLPALERRKPGDPHPYVIGTDGVQRYLTVVDECAQAGLARVQ
jgi:metallo-beta-lactamase class B